jgi:hypothetical protein
LRRDVEFGFPRNLLPFSSSLAYFFSPVQKRF